jgi:hypothetical protein
MLAPGAKLSTASVVHTIEIVSPARKNSLGYRYFGDVALKLPQNAVLPQQPPPLADSTARAMKFHDDNLKEGEMSEMAACNE